MVTLFFIIIAYSIRGRFIGENATWSCKAFYYLACACFTPLIGPWFYKLIIESRPADPDEPSSGVFPYVG